MEASSSQNGKPPGHAVLPEDLDTCAPYAENRGNEQRQSLVAIQTWLVARLAECLALEPSDIDVNTPFASYGLRSVDAVGLSGDLEEWLGRELSPTVAYDYPDVAHLARYLVDDHGDTPSLAADSREQAPLLNPAEPIAIIGMACRFPGGASSPEKFWELLQRGGEAISSVPAERWDSEQYYDPDPDASGKMYTKSAGFVADLDCFDASFFGISPREAKRMDPQHRLLLEVAWEALEGAGLAVDGLAGSSTGVFVGMMTNQEYSQLQVQQGADFVDDPYFGLGGAASVAAGRLPYLFDFHGPALSVDTACSSSLVSVHLACQSIRNGECTLALAGGVNAIVLPENVVNACKMGMLSPDGHCKPFDAAANGFVLGEGCGVVVLKRLSDAIADHDPVLAIIRGTAVNQDGRSNGLTAPNQLAQQAVIRQALTRAGIEPWEVGYVEAHGSGTVLGDPIESQALLATLGEGRSSGEPLIMGAVKANIGHLAGAAGIAGLIKTVLVLQHQQIPPHPTLSTLNPHIPWDGSPLTVPTQLTRWTSQHGLYIAGVSSFGWSGTNAHALLEAAPASAAKRPEASRSRPCQLLTLSAKTATALEKAKENLLYYVQQHPEADLADIAYTTQVGRNAFPYRRMLACRDLREAVASLEQSGASSAFAGSAPRPVAFLFSGLGEQYVGIARELYQQEVVFRDLVDACCRFLNDRFGLDVRAALYPSADDAGSTSTASLKQTAIAQPALFVVEYALAQLLNSWGIRPAALLGYSLGEYVAACLSGVLSLEDALTLVAQRARLIQTQPQGAMVAVALSEADVQAYLEPHVSLAAVNAPATCVLAGPLEAIEAVERRLAGQGVAQRRIETTHAFHSTMLEAPGERLTTLVRTLTLHKPRIPYISNVTGTWITDEQATDPAYWAQHMCQTVRFADGVGHLLQETEHLLLEVGPGLSLSSFVKQHPACSRERMALILPTLTTQSTSMFASSHTQTEYACLLENVGRLWLAGVAVDWSAFSAHEQRRRIALPTYPFERQRYWIDTTERRLSAPSPQAHGKKAEIADWFYRPVWEEVPLPEAVPDQHVSLSPCLLFLDDGEFGEQVALKLEQASAVVMRVRVGDQFAQPAPHNFTLRPHEAADYRMLVDTLAKAGPLPSVLLHMWSLDEAAEHVVGREGFATMQERGFYSLLFLAQALGTQRIEQPIQVLAVSSAMQMVTGQEQLQPEQATLLGACTVISQEHADIQCRSIDLLLPDLGSAEERALVAALAAECLAPAGASAATWMAYRDGKRWQQSYLPVRLEATGADGVMFRPGGVYLITGGLGELGLALAEHLARSAQAKLVLTSRAELPPRAEWSTWLDGHEDEERVSYLIRHIQKLESLGAEVLVVQADVADVAQMQHVLEQTLRLFGGLHGVFHLAGITTASAFRPVASLTRQECEQHYQPKVYGLFALEQILAGRELDFCLLFSSISSILGGLNFAGYAAANCFMDAYVCWHNQTSTQPWISVNWETWQTRSDQERGLNKLGRTIADYAISAQEGHEVLTRILAQRHSTRLVTSTGDLRARIQQWVRPVALTVTNQEVARNSAEAGYSDGVSMLANGDIERVIATIWQQALGIEQVGLYDNFFDLGGNSLIGLQVLAQLKQALHVQLPAVTLFEAPTISALTRRLQAALPAIEEQQQRDILSRRRQQARQGIGQQDIAIISLAGRFPGASTVEQFWHNLRQGVESITFFSDEELLAAGVDPALVHDPGYVGARPVLKDVEHFDAAFFGYSPREAELMDPQHRLFLECSWEAFERAGYDPQTYEGLVGVFGGANISTYLLEMAAHSHILESVDDYSLVISNDKDSLTTTVSYKLNLRGPSFAVQTFCSTSLVAVHLACQSLRVGECDLALAGGVSVRVPVVGGHLYQQGGMESPDGHVRTFDAQAHGCLFGDGAGVVVLKRLSEALADGDQIEAVIKGSALNNDGSFKVSYTAPSVAGQAEVVQAALEQAGVEAESISYVEAHGTATELGDPIEIAALTRAYRRQTERQQYCAIGSVKTNVGHLDRAAGVSGLIKTVLALRHQEIPASLHYKSPNPEIDFEHSPFYVNAQLAAWKPEQGVRRAGINSLGMGGTNVHVIVEEAPQVPASGPSRPWQLLLLSARTETALEATRQNLHRALVENDASDLADVAYTLQVGRARWEHRQMLLCRDRQEAIALLEATESGQSVSTQQSQRHRPVAFLFPGVGVLGVEMLQDLYAQEETFRQTVERCLQFLRTTLGLDLSDALSIPASSTSASQPALNLSLLRGVIQEKSASHERFTQTALAQPLVFVLEYALARQLIAWGIRPAALLGYSLGEYVAACLAGVFSLEDALTLVVRRARLIADIAPGRMVAVMLCEAEIQPYLSEQVSLAAITAPATCVLAGPEEAIATLQRQLSAQGIAHRGVETTHAFHSTMLSGLQEPLTELVRGVRLQPPTIPYISNVTGTWITAEQATDPAYWAQHMCQTVRFADGVAYLLQQSSQAILEVGPGQALSSFVKQHPDCDRERLPLICTTQPAPFERAGQSAHAGLLTAIGKLWLQGVPIDWTGFYVHERRRRLSLPTYPFERQRYWIDVKRHSKNATHSMAGIDGELKRIPDIGDWFSLPSWKQSLPAPPFTPHAISEHKERWLVLGDDCGIGERLVERLVASGQDVIIVFPGESFVRKSERSYGVRAGHREDYSSLFTTLRAREWTPTRIIHLWNVTAYEVDLDEALDMSFYSLLAMTQALGDLVLDSTCEITVISNELQNVTGSERLSPVKATLIGPCRVIPQENAALKCRSIDICLQGDGWEEELARQVLGEIVSGADDPMVALRGGSRWVQTFEPVRIDDQRGRIPLLREQGVYLITGGLGGIGLAVADHLARTVKAKLVLMGRSGLPDRAGWPAILDSESEADAAGIGRQIRQVLALEEAGSEVLVLAADVSCEMEMRAAMRLIIRTFGGLHGVFHAAGAPGAGLMQLKTREAATRVLAPKVQGTMVLESVLAKIPLDFMVLFSSITAITGGPGQVDYCAANAFLDAYARGQGSRRTPTIAINWSEWQWDAWGEGLLGFGEESRTFFKEHRRKFGIAFAEGIDALWRSLSCHTSNVVVCSQDFPSLVALSRSITATSVLEKERPKLHPRPAVSSSYAPPRSDAERQISAIWEELLGITPIGVNDNFFDLGGNSLTGVDLMTRLRKIFKLETLASYVLYEAPSVRAMADYIEQGRKTQIVEKQTRRGEKRQESLKLRMRETGRTR